MTVFSNQEMKYLKRNGFNQGKMFLVAGPWSLVSGNWSLAYGFWLLAAGRPFSAPDRNLLGPLSFFKNIDMLQSTSYQIPVTRGQRPDTMNRMN